MLHETICDFIRDLSSQSVVAASYLVCLRCQRFSCQVSSSGDGTGDTSVYIELSARKSFSFLLGKSR